MRFRSVVKFIDFARNHRIPIVPRNRKRGVLYALGGWGLIAVATVFFRTPFAAVSSEVNFAVQFGCGILLILLGCIIHGLVKGHGFTGYKFLKISKDTAASKYVQFSPGQRLKLIYLRGILAGSGYITYDLAKAAIGTIDNSVIYGADALMYALLAFFVLKQRFNFHEWIGILIALFGILFVLYFDIVAANREIAIWGYIWGICSSFILAILMILTSVIVQNDHPLRVAFHQCICGFIISLLIVFLLKNGITLRDFSVEYLINAFISGTCYAAALVCFFTAFLFVEPIVISISSYSLLIYMVMFQAVINEKVISVLDITSALLIAFGTGVLIHEEYKKDKMK
jgi:drug/metabolite transporter (DMT)-like permease